MQVFAKRFYGFDPVKHPLVAFGLDGNRDALISMSAPGDLIVFVGTQGEPTEPAERGRLLGLVEFARIPVDTKDLVPKEHMDSFLKPDGTITWPKALPVLRAWRFGEPRLKLIDALAEQLTFEATVRAVRLSEADAGVVMALPRQEIELPSHPVRDRLIALGEALKAGRPTTGPIPSFWTGEVTRDPDTEAWTYAMRFGKRDVWKVGHTQDLKQRLTDVNKHVPHEILGERWKIVLQQRWTCSQDAYDMEQRMFELLESHRTEGERLGCPEHLLQGAWIRCLIPAAIKAAALGADIVGDPSSIVDLPSPGGGGQSCP
jgi:hypothetical protein